MLLVRLWCRSLANAFVNTSATISWVGQYLKPISPLSNFSRMKWCCMSMCFVWKWWVGFFASAMHPWLSHMMAVAPTCTSPTSAINFLNHMASLVHWLVAMYSASVVDKTIVGCLLQFHEMAPTPTKNTYPVVERRSFASPPQSASQYPLKLTSLVQRHNFKSKVPFKYRMMRFTAIQWEGPALDMNWLTMLIRNARSRRVPTMAYINEPTAALYGMPCISSWMLWNSSSVSFKSLEFTSSGVPMGLHSSMLKPLSTSSM